MCAVGQFVMLHDRKIGKVDEVVVYRGTFVLVNLFDVELDDRYLGCPSVTRSDRYRLTVSDRINGPVNVQHNCVRGECELVSTSTLQERESADVEDRTFKIDHSDADYFLLNVYCEMTPWIEPFVGYNDNDVDLRTACQAICDRALAGFASNVAGTEPVPVEVALPLPAGDALDVGAVPIVPAAEGSVALAVANALELQAVQGELVAQALNDDEEAEEEPPLIIRRRPRAAPGQ